MSFILIYLTQLNFYLQVVEEVAGYTSQSDSSGKQQQTTTTFFLLLLWLGYLKFTFQACGLP